MKSFGRKKANILGGVLGIRSSSKQFSYITYLTFKTTLVGGHYPHFTDEKAKAEEG